MKEHGELKRILPSDRWPEKRYRYLVGLMRKFELCFALEGEPETELVPELLPDKTPLLDDWKSEECLVFLYQYPALLHGVFPPAGTQRRSCAQITKRTR
jgi:internalin A